MCPSSDPGLSPAAHRPRWSMLSTYPPTACGIATFTRSLVTALSAQGAQVDVVRAVDAEQSWPAPGVRRILTDPGLAAQLSGRTQSLAPALSWSAVAGTYLAAGLFEHAEYTRPRREHGYCVDDVARGSVVLSRADDVGHRAADKTWTAKDVPGARALNLRWPRVCELAQVAWTYLEFVAGSQDLAGRVVNRCNVDGVRHGPFGVEDCWGRALWGLGTAAARSRDPELSRRVLARFAVSVRHGWH